ncbi:hypothetical protein B0H63DRAFT_519394 [Podospora didyma]|uniref:Uncharacterized protein n=1 Tax=Podospora didyma TaxID=330526 RepID=A0AAE0U4C4_9PEZI|nr:hypothetical protein B0H63DRAFT_519394 [Podospora didyma]
MASSGNVTLFTVHVFIYHDPFLASVFLADLFSDFPDSAWRLPQLIATPPRPPPNPDVINGTPELAGRTEYPPYVNPRRGVGRYILQQPLPGSTAVGEISDAIEKQFSVAKKLHAYFTIFPQGHDYDQYPSSGFPPWHDKPLSPSTTISEAVTYDISALEVPDLFSDVPTVHLVLETKAAALRRIIQPGFLAEELGRGYERRFNSWNLLESCYHSSPFRMSDYYASELQRSLRHWRHAKYALSYLFGKQRDEDSGEARQEVERQVRKLQKDKADAKAEISTFVGEWASWVPSTKPEHAIEIPVGELRDEDVEDTVQKVWRGKQALIEEWKARDSTKAMRTALEDDYLANNPGARRGDDQHSSTAHYSTDNILTTHQVNVLEEGAPVKTISFRNEDGTLSTTNSTFTIKSGIMLWGQMFPLYHGSLQDNFTNNADNVSAELPGGTIRQHVHTYRSAARNGEWKVRRYYSNWRSERNHDAPPKDLTGWVICHKDLDPIKLIQRARAINPYGEAISLGNSHIDKDVLYINRYDWLNPPRKNIEEQFQAYAEPAVGPCPPPDPEADYYNDPCVSNVKSHGYFVAMDAQGWGLDFLRAYKQECESKGNWPWRRDMSVVERTFRKNTGEAFGAYVRKPSEYEFGWLIFSGNKHSQHDADELIAIIYDGSYEVLSGLYHDAERETETDNASAAITTEHGL